MNREKRSHSASVPGPAPTRPPLRPANIEIDLHGMTVREAEAAVERHLRAAHRDHLHIVKVVHGHGTGALKDAVQQWLQKSPLVKRQYFASHGDGGFGVTIAELDYGKGKPLDRRATYGITPRAERWK